MEKYDFKSIEAKWQKAWDDKQAFAATTDYTKPKFYALVEFPYPSGAGLHVGHPRSYTALDIVARKRRMQGYNVLYPMGWDAFGLPTENFAIKNHVHPAEVTKRNVARFKSQLKARATTSGHSGFSCSCSRRDWHTRRKWQSTGAPAVSVYWRMKKLSTAFASAAAARLSARIRASGCSRLPNTHSV